MLDTAADTAAPPRLSRWATCGPSATNLWALLVKNCLKIRRNLPMLLFIFLLPAIQVISIIDIIMNTIIILTLQVIFFCIAIGQKPAGLRLGLVNHEVPEAELCASANYSALEECDLTALSCKMFRSNATVQLVPFTSEAAARAAVVAGDTWGFISVPANFSSSLLSKFTGGVLEEGAGVVLDMANHQVSLTVRQWLVDSVDQFTTSILHTCGLEPDIAATPLTWGDPGEDSTFLILIASEYLPPCVQCTGTPSRASPSSCPRASSS